MINAVSMMAQMPLFVFLAVTIYASLAGGDRWSYLASFRGDVVIAGSVALASQKLIQTLWVANFTSNNGRWWHVLAGTCVDAIFVAIVIASFVSWAVSVFLCRGGQESDCHAYQAILSALSLLTATVFHIKEGSKTLSIAASLRTWMCGNNTVSPVRQEEERLSATDVVVDAVGRAVDGHRLQEMKVREHELKDDGLPYMTAEAMAIVEENKLPDEKKFDDICK